MCSMLGKFMLQRKINSKLAWIVLVAFLVGVIYLFSIEFLFFRQEIKNLTQEEKNITEGIIRKIRQEKVLYIID